MMSQWLFHVYMDGMVRECWTYCVQMMCRFDIIQLLFADDTALVADSVERLFRLVSEFGRVCEIESCE